MKEHWVGVSQKRRTGYYYAEVADRDGNCDMAYRPYYAVGPYMSESDAMDRAREMAEDLELPLRYNLVSVRG